MFKYAQNWAERSPRNKSKLKWLSFGYIFSEWKYCRNVLKVMHKISFNLGDAFWYRLLCCPALLFPSLRSPPFDLFSKMKEKKPNQTLEQHVRSLKFSRLFGFCCCWRLQLKTHKNLMHMTCWSVLNIFMKLNALTIENYNKTKWGTQQPRAKGETNAV